MRIRTLALAILVAAPLPFLLAQTLPVPHAVVEGNIVNAAGNTRLAGARVKLQSSQNEDPVFGKVDEQGHFVFRDLKPGFYQLMIDVPGFHESRSNVDLSVPRPGTIRAISDAAASYSTSQIPQPKVTKTTDGDGTIHASVTAPMTAYAAIAGRVTDPYGEPLAGATIELWKPRPPPLWNTVPSPAAPLSPNMRQNSVQANSRGEYRLSQLEPGTYFVAASKPGGIAYWTWASDYHTTYYPAAPDLNSAQPLKIEASQEIRADIEVLKAAGVSLSGHLLGLPVGRSLNTRMTLVPAGSEGLHNDIPFVQAESSFEFKDVLPGRYTIYAQTEDPIGDPLNPNRKPLFGAVKDVEIGKQDIAGYDVVLEPSRTLRGMVETSGCSAPGAIELQGRSRLNFEVQGTIGVDGTFTIENVPTDRFTVLLFAAPQQMPYTIPIASITKGARNVLKDGLESPWQDDEPLKIKVSCPNWGVQR